MEYSKLTYGELFELATKKKIVLPNFQRDFVWKIEQQKQLLASFLVNLPVGTFLILEGEGSEFVSRELCHKKGDFYPKDDCYYLLDGQQRLSTLKNIFYDHLSIAGWESIYDKLHFSLRNRWFLKIGIGENGEDIVGLENLRFKIDILENGKNTSKYIFETYEPTDILDNIVDYHIYKTKKNLWYHPAIGESNSEYDNKLKLAFECANQGILPLFDLLTDDKVVIKTALKKIAELRLMSLKEKVGNNTSLAINYLGHLDKNIQEKYDKNQQDQYNIRWESLKEKWVDDIMDYFKDLFKSEIVIPTVKSNELARATSVFEYMNKGGTALDTFDILVAKYAGIQDNFTLNSKLEDSLKSNFAVDPLLSQVSLEITYSPSFINIFSNDSVVKPIKDQFLNILSLSNKISKSGIASISISDIKKAAHLSLDKAKINSTIDDSLKGLNRGLAFLQFRCGIENFNKFNYKLMLLPIAIILSDDEKWNNASVMSKLEYWYWSSLFSGRFREKQNQRIIDDFKNLELWINQNVNSEISERHLKVFSDTNYSDFDTLMLNNEDKSVPSAIYNGLLSYVLSHMPSDFMSEDIQLMAWEVFESNTSLQDHHIIPLGSVTSLGESSKQLRKDKNNVLNSPLNRVLISNTANNNIRSLSIIRYMPVLNSSVGSSQLIPTTLPSPDDLNNRNVDSYKAFLKARFDMIKVTLDRELKTLLN